jgi:sec-independent protein translocase protein TatB
MFDIGFWELVLVGIVALLVLGPQRLPHAARQLGRWTGQARSYVRHFTAELEREVQVQDLAEQTRRQMADFERTAQEITKAAGDAVQPVSQGGEKNG